MLGKGTSSKQLSYGHLCFGYAFLLKQGVHLQRVRTDRSQLKAVQGASIVKSRVHKSMDQGSSRGCIKCKLENSGIMEMVKACVSE